MSKTVIKIEGVSKKYRLGEVGTGTLTHDLQRSWAKLVGKPDPFAKVGVVNDREKMGGDYVWALKDINLGVEQGEVLGIIGRNGAGKSTLLKLLSRVTAPTTGKIRINGRIISLLEVGTGFHPELTGRENIFLNGAILGMNRTEITKKMDAIVAFSGCAKYIDTPVKRYSSGMQVRLGFSVAAHLECEILIIDEVLAVGDAEFQNKCLGKMDDIQSQGRTILIVSHNMQMISQLCTTALWIDNGRISQKGDFHSVASDYLSLNQVSSASWMPSADEDDDFVYEKVSIRAPRGNTPDSIPSSQRFHVEFIFKVNSLMVRGRIALQIRDSQGTPIFSSANTDALTTLTTSWSQGRHVEYCEIPANLLSPNVYYLTISQPQQPVDKIIENICSFRIDSTDSLIARDGRKGIISPLLEWRKEI